MSNTHLPITNLILEGGGVKGIAYVGALEVLDNLKMLDKIENVAGTSAGAITPWLVSLRYTAAEIKKNVFDLDFSSFEDHKNPLRIATKYGLFTSKPKQRLWNHLLEKASSLPAILHPKAGRSAMVSCCLLR